jgi:hypothetical protein
MPIIPTGSPLWVRTVDFAHYGGNPEKSNYLSRGAIDALTDVDATQYARFTADAAAIARTSPFCVLTVTCNDPGAAPTFNYVHMATGVRLVSYEGNAAPTGFPSGANNGTGHITITFSATYTDPYGVVGAFSIAHAKVNMVHTAVARAVAQVTSATTVVLRAFDAADAALADAKMCLSVW